MKWRGTEEIQKVNIRPKARGKYERTNQVRADGSSVSYTYDGAGQLRSATGVESNNSSRLHERYGYGYDAAGSLQQRTNNLLVQTWTMNALNQLSNATRSGTYTVSGGFEGPVTSVTVNGLAASRYNDRTFARDGFTLANGNNTFTAVAQDSLGRSGTNAITAWLPSTATFVHDGNGNLTSDGRRVFEYDAEDQLTRVTVTNAWRTEFVYDGLRRMRTRREFNWTGSSWIQGTVVNYFYDGMRVIQERDSANMPRVSYTRGLDLSGSLEGAGGIGGLLMRTDHLGATPHAYYHADGVGNVTMLMSTAQTAAARYLYDPFGTVLGQSGPLADANVYQFSSKEFHAASGLVYYGYRFYEPSLQRWLNRDPIGEVGGLNLYGFVGNSPLGYVDPLGEMSYLSPHLRCIGKQKTALDNCEKSKKERIKCPGDSTCPFTGIPQGQTFHDIECNDYQKHRQECIEHAQAVFDECMKAAMSPPVPNPISGWWKKKTKPKPLPSPGDPK
jgi:RHS repeat-associated protein